MTRTRSFHRPVPRLLLEGLTLVALLSTSSAHAQYSAGNGSATAPQSTAIGGGASFAPATASGPASIAVGSTSNAAAPYSQAFGHDSSAFGDSAIAMGSGSRAFAIGSTAVGNDTTAQGIGSVALGGGNSLFSGILGATAYADTSIAIGRATVSSFATSGIAIGTGAFVEFDAVDAIAVGTGSSALSARSVAIGVGATASHTGSVALGEGARTSVGAQSGYTAYRLTAPQQSVGEVSIGSPGAERQLTNVAAGSAPTDAVNVSQLAAVGASLDALAATAVQYDDASKATLTLAGATSVDGGLSGGTRVTNVAQGAIHALSTDAVNGSQLYAVQQQVTLATTGGGIKYFHANSTGADSAAIGLDSVAVGAQASAAGQDAVAIGHRATASADNAIALGASSSADRANTVSVGSSGAERQITNVAAGTAGTDAVNVQQLNAGLQTTLTGANSYTDQRISGLSDKIDGVGRTAYAGVAAAMAMQMPAHYVPGRAIVRLGGGYFKGESAIALTARRTADNNTWSVSGGLGVSRAGVSAAAGVEWVLD
jgi:autotransporter adhesin